MNKLLDFSLNIRPILLGLILSFSFQNGFSQRLTPLSFYFSGDSISKKSLYHGIDMRNIEQYISYLDHENYLNNSSGLSSIIHVKDGYCGGLVYFQLLKNGELIMDFKGKNCDGVEQLKKYITESKPYWRLQEILHGGSFEKIDSPCFIYPVYFMTMSSSKSFLTIEEQAEVDYYKKQFENNIDGVMIKFNGNVLIKPWLAVSNFYSKAPDTEPIQGKKEDK